jgi:hypothetical protein
LHKYDPELAREHPEEIEVDVRFQDRDIAKN